MKHAPQVHRLREFGVPAPPVPWPSDGGRCLVEHDTHPSCGCPASWVLHEMDFVWRYPSGAQRVLALPTWEAHTQHSRRCRG